MSTLLYVRNLSLETDDRDLAQLFALHGTVHRAAITIHHLTGHSAGTGVIEMACDEEGDAAIAALDGYAYRGQPLVVARATGRQETNAAHTSMFESMNIPDVSELDAKRTQLAGGFDDSCGAG